MMQFFKKLLKVINPEELREVSEQLSIDQTFVKNFLKNHGKFLYCLSLEEVKDNLEKILEENGWKELICMDLDLQKLVRKIPVTISTDLNNFGPILVSCEHLIADNGSILFSSNQLKEHKIAQLSSDFIVYGTTSQLVNSLNDGLTGIKSRYQGNIPSNIRTITNYDLSFYDQNSAELPQKNAKNLYLLLFEDL